MVVKILTFTFMDRAHINIAVLAGGYSSEFEISIASGKTAEAAFREAGFRTHFILLRKEGFFLGEERVHLSNLNLDYVFNAIHGTPGEDGHISGLLEVLGIPHSTCPTFQSALTFNKAQCNKLLRLEGIRVPKGELFTEFPGVSYFDSWQLPMFVKPNRSGSSYGVSKVENRDQLAAAFSHALSEDNQILVEEGVIGSEVGCGVLSARYQFDSGETAERPVVQPIAITEIVPTEAGFFDYEAKYLGKSQEITPARLSEDLSREIMALSAKVYRVLDLRGIVRIDYIINSAGEPVLIEVNSIPGLSPASIVPQQLAYRNWPAPLVFGTLAEEALRVAGKI